MTRHAYRRFFLLLPIFVAFFALPVAPALSANAELTGKDDLVKLRQEIRKLEKEIEEIQKKIEEVKLKLGRAREDMASQHRKAFDRAVQIEVGKKVSAWLEKNETVDTPEKIVDGIEDLLRAEFGSDIVRAARRSLEEIFANVIDEGLPPENETRSARALAESFQLTCDSNFEAAWENTLKRLTKPFEELEELERKARDKRTQLEIKKRQQTATISARIPPLMIPVPSANNISLGWNPDTILTLTRKLADDPEKNKFCLLAAPQVTTSVPEFMIDQFEVTHLAYWYFCQMTGREQPRILAGIRELPGGKQEPIWEDMWPGGKIPEGLERFPITYVGRDDAAAFCAWTGARLPTEFEWEVAARSGDSGFDGRIWPWGDEYEQQRCNDATALTHPAREKAFLTVPENIRDKMPGAVPVGTFDGGRTPLGIHDMAGNVAEWTASPFLAYNGYTGEMAVSKNEKVRISGSDFSEHYAVFRGGHCDQRDMVVSAIFRNYTKHPMAPLRFVGFRRARSGVAGLDQMRHIMRNGRLDSRLQDFALCKSDTKEKRILPQLDTREGKFAIVEKFDWNEELQVPGEAHHILIINRDTIDIDSYNQLKRDTRGDKDIEESFLIGVLDTEVELLDPPLERGTWFVSFKAGRKYKDEETKKTVKLDDALMFVPYKTGGTAYRMDLKGSEVFVPKQGKGLEYKTNIVAISLGEDAKAQNDELLCTFSFDKSTGLNPKQVLVEFKIKAAKGSLAEFE